MMVCLLMISCSYNLCQGITIMIRCDGVDNDVASSNSMFLCKGNIFEMSLGNVIVIITAIMQNT